MNKDTVPILQVPELWWACKKPVISYPVFYICQTIMYFVFAFTNYIINIKQIKEKKQNKNSYHVSINLRSLNYLLLTKFHNSFHHKHDWYMIYENSWACCCNYQQHVMLGWQFYLIPFVLHKVTGSVHVRRLLCFQIRTSIILACLVFKCIYNQILILKKRRNIITLLTQSRYKY